MELDDYKNRNWEPGMMAGENPRDQVSLQPLIEELKEKDAQDRKAIRYLVMMFSVFLAIYAGGLGRYQGLMQAGYAFLAGGFLLTLIYFGVKLWMRRKIDYSESTAVFLRKAQQRHTYLPWPELLISTGLILVMGAGGGMIVFVSFEKYFPGSWIPLAVYVAVFLAATAIGHFSGKKIWNKNKRPLFEKIRALREEFLIDDCRLRD